MVASRTRVAYVVTPITFGGAEKVSLNFLRAVDRNRFDIRPILLVRPWEEPPFFAIKILQLGYDYETVPVALRPGGADRLRIPRVACRLYSILKRGGFDLIHTHGYFADICGLAVARLLGINGISTCHGFIENDRKMSVYNLLDRYALRYCKTIIAVSEGIRNELVRSGVRESRIEIIPNAVENFAGEGDLDARRQEKRRSLRIQPHEHVVGYLGRLSEEKGVRYLIEAVADMQVARNPVKLLIVGDGPERLALEQQVRNRKLEGMVVFAGFQADTENWLSAFDSFVLPSLTEGTPMALLEAMAVGVPVIATSVGGVPKVIQDGVNGVLVPPGNSQAIVEKLQMFRDKIELGGLFGRAAVDTINVKYGIGSWCRTIEHQYCKI